MYNHRKIILLAIACLTALYFIENLLHEKLAPFEIAGYKILPAGLFLFGSIALTVYLTLRTVFKKDPTLGFPYLVIMGVVVVFLSELIFQTYVQATWTGDEAADRVFFFFRNLLIMPLLGMVVALQVAVDLKYKNRLLSTAVSIGTTAIGFIVLIKMDIINLDGLSL